MCMIPHGSADVRGEVINEPPLWIRIEESGGRSTQLAALPCIHGSLLTIPFSEVDSFKGNIIFVIQIPISILISGKQYLFRTKIMKNVKL